MDISKAIDKAAGIEREDKFEGSFERRSGPTGNRQCDECGKWLISGNPCRCARPQDAPVTENATRWEGWGTSLKPAFEPIVLARKPFIGTVVGNVLEHGTGGINIDGCRIGGEPVPINHLQEWSGFGQLERPQYEQTMNTSGRWPANLLLDEEAAAVLDEQTGILISGKAAEGGHVRGQPPGEGIYGGGRGLWKEAGSAGELYGDSGGASRFFATFRRTEYDLSTCGDEFLMDENMFVGESQEIGKSSLNLPTDGFGSKPMASSPGDTKFTTKIETHSTTISGTSNFSANQITTNSINENEKIIEPETELLNAVANDAISTNPLIDSPSEKPGHTRDTANPAHPSPLVSGDRPIEIDTTPTCENIDVSGNRFFYVAKPDSQEKNAGLSTPSLFTPEGAPDRNHHVTVKPIDLMCWLCRLITPPGGLILDPFLGSGTTGIAASLGGFDFIGIEREPDYMKIAEARISHWTGLLLTSSE